jgi:hypothetical protein
MALPKLEHPTYELEIPSTGKKIKYRPFVVKEEKVLLLALQSEDAEAIQDAVRNLLSACIQTRGVKIDDLATFDLEYIFLQIRAASVGEMIEMQVTCLDDGETRVTTQINLHNVKVIKPEGHTNKIMLDDTVGVIMKYPGFDRFVEGSIIEKDVTSDNVFEILADSIDQMFDTDTVYDSSTTTRKEKIEFVEKFTNEQFEKIQKFFETAPKLSHTFSVVNPKTGEKSEYTIEGLQSFFG